VAYSKQANDIQRTVHHLDRNFSHLDKRVAILEERSQVQAEDIRVIHNDVRETKGMIEALSAKIDAHRLAGARAGAATQRWVITTVVGIAATLLTLLLQG
jgi:uncharacterized coiled-coil protein SlyX